MICYVFLIKYIIKLRTKKPVISDSDNTGSIYNDYLKYRRFDHSDYISSIETRMVLIANGIMRMNIGPASKIVIYNGGFIINIDPDFIHEGLKIYVSVKNHIHINPSVFENKSDFFVKYIIYWCLMMYVKKVQGIITADTVQGYIYIDNEVFDIIKKYNIQFSLRVFYAELISLFSQNPDIDNDLKRLNNIIEKFKIYDGCKDSI
jgi:hypothetical protein